MKIAIIGAGIAGLATAVRLASCGHDVTVFEANSYPGGKLSEFSLPSLKNKDEFYRFDAGPSLFTMPHYVEELFEIAGIPSDDYFSYRKQKVVCQYFWEDGIELTAYSDPEKLQKEVQEKLGVDGRLITDALQKAKFKYDIAGKLFLENSLHKTKTWMLGQVIKAFFLMPMLDIFKSMNKTHEQAFNKNPKLVQLFNRFATYNGSDPYKASGMLSMIPHFEHGIGTYYPEGGMSKITKAIFQLAEKKGVKFRFNTRVETISHSTQNAGTVTTANGIVTANGEKFLSDVVVSNMDVYFTYKKLLPQFPFPQKTLNQERSTSALIFYWGIRKTFGELNLHNIFFSGNYRKEFEHLAQGTLYDDPTVYINITSGLTPTDAPENCENWFVMVNAPHNKGQNWEDLIQTTRRNIISKLSRLLKTDISVLIDAEEILSPVGIEAKTQSFTGSLYGTSSNSLMSAFLRHANFSSKIKNLYFCGGSVHPGGGIPLCLLSAKITSEIVNEKR